MTVEPRQAQMDMPVELVVHAAVEQAQPGRRAVQFDLTGLAARAAVLLWHRQRRVAAEPAGVGPPTQVDPVSRSP